MTRPTMPNQYPAGPMAFASSTLASRALIKDLTNAQVSFDDSAKGRADHGRDWWPLTIPDVAEGHVPRWPAVVVQPTSTDEVSRVLEIASKHGVAVTAQGGRSSVVGGAAAPDGAIALDMTRMNQVLDVDTVSGTVSVEAGVFGPDLERAVGELGWTVGHFPQSFDLATVGGWIACRGAGQYSNRYGKIEDIVRGLSVVLASGEVLELGGRAPREAVGPDLVQLFVGSEGTLGVITRATLVMHPTPASERRAAYGFVSFDDGLDACRRIMQRDARPAVLRLYDEVESTRSFGVESCALIVLDEGDAHLVEATTRIVAEECAAATELDPAHVATWLEHRNDVGALAALWERGYVVDTIEVAGTWATLSAMRRSVIDALRQIPGITVASVHQSHAYLDGACLYFTFAGRPEDDVTGFYRRAWECVTKEVLNVGGALSHHHGVGRNRARFAPEALGSGFGVLVNLKHQLDPDNIMNPGVLGLGGAPW
ncbi:MAG: FAD-binding oxidoreductase [Acidimicrobiales bacterium]